MKTFLVLLLGLVGIIIGATLYAIENDGAAFITKFIFKLCGLLIFVGTTFFVQKYWKSIELIS
ncbi:hypothetical protein NSA56_18040 [Oceanobacillus caeni]|uniref:hypothetical protein n=1 Tax=Bacillaceae TaxID=186817 RepID=UPI000620F410|nr:MULTISPECIES: hypothetical protein [Bacillaceae]KKE79460.1 hypothetical protein WH51_07250 [Bacilli bacterium VT-13-104]PZD81414.1 hypothetical protein DEJ64_17370 [Bacilli bacterium]MBU8792538.1 hypothetical protein [Oceanobacillus caeni]MCR1836234.1 hypothetical protein [Oceanobacillus caeni]MED4473802.1 hypothetical protein [Oceanobacillus caeni]